MNTVVTMESEREQQKQAEGYCMSFVCVLIGIIIVSYIMFSEISREEPCICKSGFNCYCCRSVGKSGSEKVCTSLKYSPEQFAMSTTITYNDTILFNKSMMLPKNPLPICVSHPENPQMEVCLKLRDLKLEDKKIYACGEFEVTLNDNVSPLKLKLCCFKNKNDEFLRSNRLYETCDYHIKPQSYGRLNEDYYEKFGHLNKNRVQKAKR